MKLKQLLKIVLINIYHNKMRTFLTTLGVIVGTATIFLVVAIGRGGEAQVNEQYSRLNVGTIMVMPAQRGRVLDPLTKEDAELFQASQNIKMAFPILNGSGSMKYGNYSSNASYYGILPAYLEANNLTINQGRFLDDTDESKRERVAVIGAGLAELLTDGNPTEILDKTLDLNRRKFVVVGILNRMGDSGSPQGFDDTAFIPYSAAERYLLGTRANPTINAIAEVNTVQAAIQDITTILNANHLRGGSEQFRILDAGSRLVAAQETARTMSLLLLSVAVVVLIVSGIGIMNVMFVTVKERTKEIGTLKAIGAKKREILGQFLIEAVVISLAGGILGVMIGGGMVPLLKYFEILAIPSLSGVLIGLLFSVTTGVFFGFYPAWQAADLNPIDALRYE
ncbi:MAG: macrolide ABC transporter permease [Clostridiaceae bacterium BRH_c20a]|nr:MAG: macrolide ABC transporter permease [Clostridiaceae bacterium BRH_c20a]